MATNVFISYNHSGEARNQVREISDILKNMGLDVWLDEYEIKPGDSIYESINKGLEQAGYVVAVVGPNDRHGSWVNKELEIAKGKGKPIIPVMINNATVDDIPDVISDHLAIDASNNTDNLVKVYESIDAARGIWARLKEYIVND